MFTSYLLLFIFGFLTLFLLYLSKIYHKVNYSFDNSKGEIFYLNNSNFYNEIINYINNSQNIIRIICKNFDIDSTLNFLEIPLKNAFKRGIKIFLISETFINKDYIVYQPIKFIISSDYFLIDDNFIAIPTIPLNYVSFQMGIIIKNSENIFLDILSFFNLGIEYPTLKLPSISKSWKSELLVRWNYENPHKLNQGNVSFSQGPSIFPPVRDNIFYILRSIITENTNKLYISTSNFIQNSNKTCHFIIQEIINKCSLLNIEVKILIENNNLTFLESLKWASTLASKKNVEFRIYNNTLNNYIITNDHLLIGPYSFSKTILNYSFGLILSLKNSFNININFLNNFNNIWDNSIPFKNYLNLIWN